MKRALKVVNCVVLGLLFAGVASAEFAGSTTYVGFNPKTGQNDAIYDILYRFPDPQEFGPGPYPVFMWTPGTFEFFKDPMSQLFLFLMAERGFIAATVEYHNTNYIQRCPDWVRRAESIYDATRSTSAVSVMCALAGASCSLGLVTMGISEGAAMAILAKNFAPDVEAAYGLSISDRSVIGNFTISYAECLDKPKTAIPANRLMIVNGESDGQFGGQTPLMNVSGIACPQGAFQCWSTDGSGAGWYIVQDTEVVDLLADHCYQLDGGCRGRSFDTGWYWGIQNWQLRPNLDWLATLGTRRNFAARN